MPQGENMGSWESIIGLEIHIELKAKSKMFCSCSADYFGRKPNTHCCPVCLGLPGALPVANRQAVEWTVLAGMALGCKIPLFSKFDRKNYFYPDLPKGYQISQYDLPLAINGQLRFKSLRVQEFKVRIRRVHLEEDTAKMIHGKTKKPKNQKTEKQEETLIDFNRSGVPLMEVVTEPDLRSPQEAKEFLKKLQQIIRYLGISDCDMEKGSMRIEPNVSVRRVLRESRVPRVPRGPRDTSDGGRMPSSEVDMERRLPKYKVEIKNINSFRFAEKAIDYEIKRQVKLFEKGFRPVQETRGWDEVRQVTYPQRVKEEAQDYRYFPEPDLPPISWTARQLTAISRQLPELPAEKEARFAKKYKLGEDQIQILIATREKADYFEGTVRAGKKHELSPESLANVIINKRVDIEKLLPAELIQVLVKKKSRSKISEEELRKIISKVIKENTKAVKDYKKGKKRVIQFLIGQIMREAKGKADPGEIRELIKGKIERFSTLA